jgi:PAS domain S-box-containing protein
VAAAKPIRNLSHSAADAPGPVSSAPEIAAPGPDRTSIPAELSRDRETAFQDAGETHSAAPDGVIRAAAGIAAVSELAYVCVLLAEAAPALRRELAMTPAVNAIIAAALLWSTYQQWFKEYWRIITLTACSLLIANTMLATVFTGNLEWLMLTIITVVVGASALAPWTTAWQSALSTVAVAAFAAYSWNVEVATVHWLVIAVAVTLGEITTHFGMRYRRELEARLSALRTTEGCLRAEARERADAQRHAQASEQIMETIFQAIPDAMVVRRMSDGTVVRCNKYISTYGYDPAVVERVPETLDQAWVDPADRERFALALREHGSLRNMELELRSAQGRIAPSLVSAVLANIDGELCAVAIARDITELKEAEQRLRDREEMFRKVFDRTSDAISINRVRDGAYVEVNREFLRSVGLAREQVIGRTDLDLGLWPSEQDRSEFAQRLARDGGARNLEVKFRAPDGRNVYALVTAALMSIAGEPCVAVFGHDITAAKKTQTELLGAREQLSHQVEALQASRHHLAESEASLRRIFDANLDAVTINDMETGAYLDMNEEFLRRTGFKREEVMGHSFDGMNLSPDKTLRRRFVHELETNGRVRNMEADFDIKDGEQIHCLVSGIVLELGGRRCCMTLARDVTELKETERQLVAAREAALAASRAKSEFLSSMSHEIRTPMNSILGMADLLAESAMGAEQRYYVESIVTNGNALLGLINGILDLARVESGRLALESGRFDLREVLETAAATLVIAAHEKNLELTVRLARGTPTALVGDAMRLRQVLINLAGNAIKFTQAGEIAIEARPDPEEAERVWFSVRDTGIGIPADKLAAWDLPLCAALSN